MAKKIDIDTKTFVRFWLVIFAIGLITTFVMQAKMGILLVALSAFLAIALMPLAKKIDRIDRRHSRSPLSSVLAVVFVVVLVVGVIAAISPILVGEIAKFSGQVPEIVDTVTSKVDLEAFGRSIGIDNLREQIITAGNSWSSGFLGNIGDLALTSIGAVGGFLTGTVIVTALTVLFMLQGPELLEKLWRRVGEYKGKKAMETWRRLALRVAGVIAKYISGQAVVAVLDALVTMLLIFLLSLIFPIPASFVLPLGLLAGVLYMIPMFGPVINCVIATLLLAVNSIWGAAVYVVLYLIYEQVANNMIAPKIQGKGMGLSPLLILISITVGTYAFGVVGTFVAIPIAGCIKVFIEEYPNIKSLGE